MNAVVVVLVALAGLALGLRVTAVLLSPRVHPLARLALSAFAGASIVLVTLELCDSYRVFDLGLGLLLSLSPVGLYDLTKWWFRWRRAP